MKNKSESHKNCSSKDGCYYKCKECVKVTNHNYKTNSKVRLNEYTKNYKHNKRINDPQFKQAHNMRNRINSIFNTHKNICTENTIALIGISHKLFIKWIEFQFKSDTTFENYGVVWNIDPVIPLNAYNLLNENELKKAMSSMNTSPIYVKRIKLSQIKLIYGQLHGNK